MAKERGPGCRFSRALGVGARLSPPAPASRPVSLSCAHCMSVQALGCESGAPALPDWRLGPSHPASQQTLAPGPLHGQHLEGRQVVRLRSPGPVPGCGAGWRGDGRPARPGTAAQHSAQVSPQGSRCSPRSLALPSPAGPRSSLPLRRVCAAATRLSCQRKTSPSSPPLPRTASPEPPGTARPHGALPQPGRSRRGRVAPGSRRASRSGTTREFREGPHPMWPRAKGLRGEGAGRGWGESLRGFPLALQEPPPGPWEEANV